MGGSGRKVYVCLKEEGRKEDVHNYLSLLLSISLSLEVQRCIALHCIAGGFEGGGCAGYDG